VFGVEGTMVVVWLRGVESRCGVDVLERLTGVAPALLASKVEWSVKPSCRGKEGKEAGTLQLLRGLPWNLLREEILYASISPLHNHQRNNRDSGVG
jgi:hypothetical protein